MTRAIIVRHGQSTYNIEKRIQGRTDFSRLTQKGCDDASQVGKFLSQIKFDAIYCSPLTRAQQTAAIIHQELSVNSEQSAVPQPSHQLLEVDLPLWEKMLSADVQYQFADDYRIWKEKPHEFKMLVPDGDGTREHFPVLSLYAQAREFWQEILSRHQGKTILIVGHNGINRSLISTALNIPPSRYHSLQQSNCGVSVLNFSGALGEPAQLESLNQTQHMGVTFPSLRPNHQGLRLFLVRHGETDWNRQGRYQGQTDVTLNQQGTLQSQKLSDLMQNVELDLIVSSSMSRAKETAEIILHHHPHVNLQLDDGFKEITHGFWEGKLETDIAQDFPEDFQQWLTKPAQLQLSSGENLQKLWQRSVKIFDAIVEEALSKKLKTILVVAHGGINQVLVCHIMGLSPENFWNFRQSNGSVSVIDYPLGLDGLPVLQAMNITSHIHGGAIDKTVTGAM
ncbi:histidine phosphatase family protein [Calothrix rhizosoleniae]|uniref:histidine phosphatase family protein n=1 Tax=Calothrix rhizosoleniae TaxID=888997 RepID=UPI000B4A490B|nr:histidine phosphatase family protein [Calothrix rhizosoleniae]